MEEVDSWVSASLRVTFGSEAHSKFCARTLLLKLRHSLHNNSACSSVPNIEVNRLVWLKFSLQVSGGRKPMVAEKSN